MAAADRENMIVVGTHRPLEAMTLRRLITPSQLVILELDTSSLASVKRFVVQVREKLGASLILAVPLNAGVQIVSGDQFSVDGFGLTFATNVLGHMALFQGLLLQLTSRAIVVSTASGTHDASHKLSKPYGFHGGYSPSAAQVAAGQTYQVPILRSKDGTATQLQSSATYYSRTRWHAGIARVGHALLLLIPRLCLELNSFATMQPQFVLRGRIFFQPLPN